MYNILYCLKKILAYKMNNCKLMIILIIYIIMMIKIMMIKIMMIKIMIIKLMISKLMISKLMISRQTNKILYLHKFQDNPQ